MTATEALKQDFEQYVPVIEASQFRNPNAALNAIISGKVPLPCWLRIGDSSFKLTEENKNQFSLAVLFATDEAWDDKE